MHLFKRNKIWQSSEEGQGLVEYALVLVFIAVVVLAVLMVLGPRLSEFYGNAACALDLDSPIRGASVHQEQLIIHVRRPTNIILEGAISGGGSCQGECRYDLSGLSPGQRFTVSTDEGQCFYTYSIRQ